MKIISIIFIILAMVGCSPGQHEPQVKSLDSMKVELSNLRMEFEKLDTATMKITYDTIARYLKVIKSTLKDTLTREQAEFMNKYYSIRKPFMNFSNSYRLLHEEMEFTESQLNDLARSLEKGRVPEGKAKEYYTLEMNSAQTLHETVRAKLNQMQGVQQGFDTLHPMITAFIKTQTDPPSQ